MARKFLLTWTNSGVGGHNEELSWSDVVNHLEAAWRGSGCVELDILEAPDPGPQQLQARIEQCHAMLMLGILTEDDHEVRTYAYGAGEGQVEILGDRWSRSMTCCDFNIVLDCFRQFYETGDVETSLLR